MTMWVTMALAAQVSVAAAPERVCVDPRTGYPNVDFVLSNTADKPVAITEIRGLVFDRDGAVIERRLVWQDSLKAFDLTRSCRRAARRWWWAAPPRRQ